MDQKYLFSLVKEHVKDKYKIDIYDADTHGIAQGYSEEEAKQIAKALVGDLIEGFIQAQKGPKVLAFGYDDIIIPPQKMTYKVVQASKGKFAIHVNFPAKFLYRPSLVNTKTYERTGEGIKDIFALFTQGYSTTKRTYGWWENETVGGQKFYGHQNRGIVATPLYWPRNPFIKNIINDYEYKYPGILIEYPDEWK